MLATLGALVGEAFAGLVTDGQLVGVHQLLSSGHRKL